MRTVLMLPRIPSGSYAVWVRYITWNAMREAIITLVIHYNAFYTTQVKQFIIKDQMGLLRKADEVDKMTIL